jgi:hypothetical protein
MHCGSGPRPFMQYGTVCKRGRVMQFACKIEAGDQGFKAWPEDEMLRYGRRISREECAGGLNVCVSLQRIRRRQALVARVSTGVIAAVAKSLRDGFFCASYFSDF